MISKEIKMREPSKSSFKRLAEYITDTQGNDLRVQRVKVTNFESNDLSLAIQEALLTQSLNTRTKKDKTLHMIISFKPEDLPKLTNENLDLIENEICKYIGLKDNQRISVFHMDTDHPHLHLAINKINPKTLKMFDDRQLWNKFGEITEQLEKQLGLSIDRHQNKRTNYEKQQKRFDNEEQLIAHVKNYKDQLSQANSWKEFASICVDNGFMIKERGNGLVFYSLDNIKLTTKCSNISREFSKDKLQQKFGDITSKDFFKDLKKSVDREKYKEERSKNNKYSKDKSNAKANDFEHFTGEESFISYVKKYQSDLSKAKSWSEFANICKENGFMLKERGNGLIFYSLGNNKIHCKCSSISREFSKANLIKKFGDIPENFFKNNDQDLDRQAKKFYEKDPVKPLKTDKEKQLYKNYKDTKNSKSQGTNSINVAPFGSKQKSEEIKQVYEDSKFNYQLIKLLNLPPWLKKLLYALERKAIEEKKREIEYRHNAYVSTAKKHKIGSSWNEFLANESNNGNTVATEILQRHKRQNTQRQQEQQEQEHEQQNKQAQANNQAQNDYSEQQRKLREEALRKQIEAKKRSIRAKLNKLRKSMITKLGNSIYFTSSMIIKVADNSISMIKRSRQKEQQIKIQLMKYLKAKGISISKFVSAVKHYITTKVDQGMQKVVNLVRKSLRKEQTIFSHSSIHSQMNVKDLPNINKPNTLGDDPNNIKQRKGGIKF